MGVTLSYNGLGGKVKFSGTSGRFKTTYLIPSILDYYPGAVAAYSVRKLRGGYIGAAIRVRRSSDNAEQDIKFIISTGLIDTVSLLSFCGAGNGFVTTWYDQSGNNNHAIQATTASQPQIVSSGTLYYIFALTGIPAIFFNSQFLSFTNSIDLRNDLSYFMVHRRPAAPFIGQGLSISNNNGTFRFAEDPDGYFRFYKGSGTTNYSTIASNASGAYIYQILQGFFQSNTLSAYYNGVTMSTSTSTSANTDTTIQYIGKLSTTVSTNSYGQEIIIYDSAQIANRVGIVSNINLYYTVY